MYPFNEKITSSDLEKAKNNPRFCIIAPTAYLNGFATRSNRHLILAHLVDTDEEYAQFYRSVGGLKIMDNGAFELGESYAPDKLIELGEKCSADAIVLPDYPFQPATKTIRAAKDLKQQVREAGFRAMFVPQSQTGNVEDWIEGYRWAAEDPDIDIIGMSILGMPNAIPHVHKAYARVVLTQILIERGYFNFDKYHHYLGLNSGPALEIPTLINMKALSSCDSSNPVWMAICGHAYSATTDSYLGVSKVPKEVDFSYPMTDNKQVLSTIHHNVHMTLELFKDKSYVDLF